MTVEVRNDITISCDRDPILNEINAIMRNSNDILNSVDKHKSILEDCEQIVKDLNPVLAVDKSRDEKIANLEKSVSGINPRVGDTHHRPHLVSNFLSLVQDVDLIRFL